MRVRPLAAWRPVLLRMTVFVALVSPTEREPKVSEVGTAESVMGETPSPESATEAVAGMALVEEAVRVAVSVPTTDGVKVIWIKQEAPGLRAVVQAVTSVGGLRAKSAAVAPALRLPMAKVGRLRATCPVLVT